MWNFVILVFFTYVFGSFLSFPSWPPPFNFNALAYNPPDYESIVSSIHVQKATFSKHFENLVVGPEAFAFTQDSVYTGLADGRIIEIPIESFFTDSAITPYLHSFAQLHDSPQIECENTYWNIKKCGRPLGLRVNGSHLYVLDAKFGLFRIPLAKSYVKDHLLKPDIEIYQSNRTVFFNSFVFDPIHSHLVYLSITSLRYNVDRVPYSLFEHEATGQVVALDLRSGKVTKIASGLHFANGIEVSSDAKWLFVSETTAFRLRRIELKRVHEHLFVVSATGNEELELQTFGAQLPGEPDNIVAFKGKLLVGFALARSDGKWIVSDYLASWPSLRRGLLRILYAVSVPLEYLVTLLDTLKLPAFSMIRHEANKYSFDFWSGYVIYNLAPNKGAFAVIDQETGAIETLYALPDTSFVSEAAIVPGTDTILVGSFRNPFIGVLKGLKI